MVVLMGEKRPALDNGFKQKPTIFSHTHPLEFLAIYQNNQIIEYTLHPQLRLKLHPSCDGKDLYLHLYTSHQHVVCRIQELLGISEILVGCHEHCLMSRKPKQCRWKSVKINTMFKICLTTRIYTTINLTTLES